MRRERLEVVDESTGKSYGIFERFWDANCVANDLVKSGLSFDDIFIINLDFKEEVEGDEEDEEDFDPRSGDMMEDLGLTWRDFY
jgi:hypothetical protein